MKLICSIATIIERGKARWYITTHICSPWRCLWSRHKSQDVSQDVTPLQVKSSDELARSTKWRFEIEHDKKQQPENTAKTNQIFWAAVITHMQDARHPIHRVRIPHSKFSSPKTWRDVHESSLKINTILLPLKRAKWRQNPPEGHWCACVRGRLEIVWRHKHANEEITRSLFSCFLRWNFGKVCMLHDIDAYFTI